MNTTSWYRLLNKPTWAPQEWVFGAVWSTLYPIIFVVNIYVVMLLLKGKIGLLVALPFWLNLLFNFMFTPLQFGLRNNWLAMIDIYLVLATIIWAIVVIWPVSKVVAVAFAPYLVWVAIATALQTYLVIHN
ncbi:MAG: TspO/MBR family protein [bacterium]